MKCMVNVREAAMYLHLRGGCAVEVCAVETDSKPPGTRNEQNSTSGAGEEWSYIPIIR